MRTGWALFFVIGLSVVFTAWQRPIEYYCFFPLSEQKLTLQTYVYFLFEHLVLVTVLYLWHGDSSGYSRDYVLMFLFLQVLNLLDYIIRYNEPIVRFGDFKVTLNIVSIFFYALFLTVKGWKEK